MTLSRNFPALTLCLASALVLLPACRIPVRETPERRLQEIVPPGRKEATQHVDEAEASTPASQPEDQQRSVPSVPDNRVTALQREARAAAYISLRPVRARPSVISSA